MTVMRSSGFEASEKRVLQIWFETCDAVRDAREGFVERGRK